jgi:cobalt-zinc-cadmium efflux system outer membrane protein
MFKKWISQAGLALGLVGLCASATMAASIAEPNSALFSPVFTGESAPSAITRFVVAGWQAAPEQASAEAAVFAAEAHLAAAARPLYNPELSIEAERADVNTKVIGLSQTIDMGRKRHLREKTARLEVAATEADLVDNRQAFAANMLENLIRYQNTRNLHQLAVRRTHLMERFSETAEKRLAAGDIAPLDVALAQVAYTNARIAQAGTEQSLSQSAATLRVLTGASHESWPELLGELPGMAKNFQLDAVINQLPLIRALAARAKAQALSAKRVERERFPDPTFGLTGGREGRESLIGLSVSFPIPVRNTHRAEALAATHEATQAQQELLREKRAATAQIEGAAAAYRAVGEAWGIWLQNGQESLTDQVTLLQRMWEGGDLSASDYLMQAGQNVETQAAATELAGEVWLAALELLHVTGSLDAWLMSRAAVTPAHSH